MNEYLVLNNKPEHSIPVCGGGVCACVRVCVRVSVCECVRVHMRLGVE